jgi:uncharacterized membrane protein
MEKLRKLWFDTVDSLWFVPGLLTLSGGTLAVLLVRYNDQILGDIDAEDVWWVFGGSPGGAMSVLEAISGSIITVTGVVFSVTIIALQLASSQFTPRVLRQFMADRANQLVLGVFIATFTYSLIVLRTVRTGEIGDEFVPAVAVTGAVLLALASIAFLIFFINHLARSIQAAIVIDAVTGDTTKVLAGVFPSMIEDGESEADRSAESLTPESSAEPLDVYAARAGYVQAVERQALCRLAAERDIFIRLEVEIGAHLLPGQIMMKVWPGGANGGERTVLSDRRDDGLLDELKDAVVLGIERTPHQDLKHGVIELLDIAVKGLSPSINDPTTAINAIQHIGQLLLDLAWRERGDRAYTDDEGGVRLVVRRPRLDDVVGLAFDQIRHYGAGNAAVAIALIDTLAELSALSPANARAPFLGQLHAVIRTARSRIDDEGDSERVQRAAAAALQRAAAAPPPRRPHR